MTSRTVVVGVLAAVLTIFLLPHRAAIALPDQYLPADPVLEVGESLVRGQAVASTNGRHGFVFQNDGDLAVVRDGSVLWSSGTAGQGGDRVVMQSNGVLAMFRSLPWGSEPVWTSRSVGADGAVLSVRDEGGVVIRRAGSPIVWSAALPAPDVGLEGVKHIVYGRGDQMVWLVSADGTLFDSYLVSGRATWPVPGRYKVLSKSPRSQALAGHVWMRHMVRFVQPPGRAGTGFHSIPVTWSGRPIQTEDELGQFRSLGCVRQRDDKAEQLYNWATLGTPVIVVA